MHLDSLKVKVGDKVKRGDLIATVGSTGRSTGPHLDWRMFWRGARLDPALLAGGNQSVRSISPIGLTVGNRRVYGAEQDGLIGNLQGNRQNLRAPGQAARALSVGAFCKRAISFSVVIKGVA